MRPDHLFVSDSSHLYLLTRLLPRFRIGSILGKGGKILTDIQANTRTRVRISQRGDFIPGTKNRSVTITGQTREDVEAAEKRINECIEKSETG